MYILLILEQFDTENYILLLDIVQNLSELLKLFLYGFWTQNVSIPADQNMSQGGRCFNTPKLYATIAIFKTVCKIILEHNKQQGP